ncbi:MAG: UvrD-helicase domain-containing protein [Gammaproteobacteria bacterium]|nr:UvrD-helicase domain-containing protein [Gammaproteobacteria bacterium]
MTRQAGPSSPHINATVMASAGTGKTWLLVSRLLRLLLHGARADAILAITFTRKAAAEMQSRLAERLFALAAASDAELAGLLRELALTPDEATLARARGLYEALLQSGRSVRTTTFHAFCQDILRRFPLEADVPPGFELLESSGELLRTAWDLLMEQATLNPDSDTARALEQLLGYSGGLHGLQQALFTFLHHRGDWWAYTEGEAEPQEFALERLRVQLRLNDDESPLQGFFTTQREQALGDYCELLNQHPIATHNTRLELLAKGRDPALTLEERFGHCREALLTGKDEARACKPSAAQAKKMGDAGQQRFIELHSQLSAALLRTLDQLAAGATLNANRAWYAVGGQLLTHFQRLKAERRQLDFTDLEWRAYRLLHRADNAQWVQYKLDQRIEHLLIDEFQDTNPTQWRLLQPLLQEMAAGGGERMRSVFLVGDAKQSIYRFRRAEPRLFQAAHEWLQQHLDAQGYPLHTSWRSAPAIMQCVNKLFGDNGPLQEALHQFTPHDTHLHGLWGTVTVLPLISQDEGEEPPPTAASALRNPLLQPRVIRRDERYRREGELIAGEITRLIAAQTPVGASGSARPMHYGDIMILVRSRAHVGEYERALRRTAIPYIGAERGTLLQSLEVRDMVALLELLITPYSNLALATVLRSPLFACGDEALMQLTTMAKESGNWYQRLTTLAQHDPEHPLHRAWQLLGRWRAQAGKVPIHDLLDRIYNEGNVLARYQAAYPLHLHARCDSNLTRFLELALAIDSGRYPSLGRFLSRLGEMRENSDEAPDEAPASGSGERVRLMTIHAAKGLEAPVVFVADAARNGLRDRPFRALVDWPAEAPRPQAFLLVGKKGQQEHFTREALAREQLEERREDANLLYVALTRARQHLYLSGCAPARGEGLGLGWYGAAREALDPLGELPLDLPCQLQSGTPPPLCTATIAQTEETSAAVPKALSRPLTLTPSNHEIAPSHHFGEGLITTPADGDEDGRRRGIAIHRLLELMSGDQGATRQEITARVARELGMEDDGTGELRQWSDEAWQLLAEPALQRIVRPVGMEALNEVAIIYPHQGRTVHGVIDRLLLGEEEVWVIDYKSHRQASRDDLPALAAPYRQQLRYYAQGVARLWPGRRVRTFLLFTHCRELFETTDQSADG